MFYFTTNLQYWAFSREAFCHDFPSFDGSLIAFNIKNLLNLSAMSENGPIYNSVEEGEVE